MDPKDYLEQHRVEEIRARRLTEEYKNMGQLLSNFERAYGAPSDDKTKKRIANIKASWQQLPIRERAAAGKCREIKSMIKKIPGNEGVVLYKRYVEYENWDLIANELHYSTSNIHKIHNTALSLVKTELEKRT